MISLIIGELKCATNSVYKFTAVNEDCIDIIVKKLKSKSSTGYDNISNILIKHARTILVKPLTLLVNQIIHTCEFPRQLKIGRVKPLYKKVISQVSQIIATYLCYLLFQKFLRMSLHHN